MSAKLSILIIEDEKNICDFIAAALKNQDYRVFKSYSGMDGLSQITSRCPDILLLDLGLPDMDGTDILGEELCRKKAGEIIRSVRSWSRMPIIVISARTLENEKVLALDLGADDYITKPFGTSELLARIRTAVRHLTRINATNSTSHIFRASGLVIDFDRRRITVHEQEVHLTQVEYKIVSMLANNSGKVITYDALISHVWGPYADDNNRILRVNMANIRRKLERNPAQPEYIFTEIGIGYRMIDAEA